MQAFWCWRDAVRALKFRARQRHLARYALALSPVFSRALLSIRRITLAVSTDPAGSWRKMPSECHDNDVGESGVNAWLRAYPCPWSHLTSMQA